MAQLRAAEAEAKAQALAAEAEAKAHADADAYEAQLHQLQANLQQREQQVACNMHSNRCWTSSGAKFKAWSSRW
ncbi:hypothetical protein QJQ45_013210 [Haematococcus lacustris]|nr:hypothetical protein QJQ45_013210 [Haematococcus lacustris]